MNHSGQSKVAEMESMGSSQEGSDDVKEHPISQILRYTAFHISTPLSLGYGTQSMASYN